MLQYFGLVCLIMDGFKGHTKVYEDIKLILLNPSARVQPLDLLGFNMQKISKNKSQIAFQEEMPEQTKEIVKIMNIFKSISTLVIITKA